jgi:hypothetical protein
MRAKIAFVMALAALSLIATAVPLAAKEKKPKNKGPVIEVIHAPIDRIKAELIQQLASQGISIESETAHQIVFGKDLDGVGTEFMARFFLGKGNSGKSRLIAIFIFVPNGEETTVTGRQEFVTPMAFGNVNRVSLDRGKAREKFLGLLQNVKEQAENASSSH